MEKKKVLSIQEVISTKGSFHDMLKSDIEEKLSREKKKIELLELPLPISFVEFCDLFVAFGTHTLLRQNQKIVFEMDKYNEPIIEQLFFFLTRDSQFQGDLNKGILVQGKFGCGKTVIMETFAEIHNHIIKRMGIKRPLITFIKSLDLQEKLITQSTTSFVYRPLIIDEFGREPKTVQDYGNTMRPISELLSLRSDNGSITHGITNFSFERLVTETYYGAMIGDRLKMMFNLMPMKGDSKRK